MSDKNFSLSQLSIPNDHQKESGFKVPILPNIDTNAAKRPNRSFGSLLKLNPLTAPVPSSTPLLTVT